MTAARLLSISDCADRLRLARPTIRRAIERAGLKADNQGRYVFSEVERAVAATTDANRVAAHSVAGRGDHDPGNKFTALARAKAEAEAARARKLSLQNQMLEGKLIGRDQVTAAVTAAVARARTALMNLGPRLAPKIVGVTDERELMSLIEAEVRDILGNLAREAEEMTV